MLKNILKITLVFTSIFFAQNVYAQNQPPQKAANNDMSRVIPIHAAGRVFLFEARSKKYPKDVEQQFIQNKFSSCQDMVGNKKYCVCVVNYYLHPHGIPYDKLIEYELQVKQLTRGPDGKQNIKKALALSNDPRFQNYFSYGSKAVHSCDKQFPNIVKK